MNNRIREKEERRGSDGVAIENQGEKHLRISFVCASISKQTIARVGERVKNYRIGIS
jgi:hypothetical protein